MPDRNLHGKTVEQLEVELAHMSRSQLIGLIHSLVTVEQLLKPPGKSSLTISAKPIGVGGCVATTDSSGRTIWIADAHRDGGKRFVVHADEKLIACWNWNRRFRWQQAMSRNEATIFAVMNATAVSVEKE